MTLDKRNQIFLPVVSLLLLSLITINIQGKEFSQLARNKIPVESPYESIRVPGFADQKCFSICHYEQKCLALLIEKIADSADFNCSFYNQTIHYLTLVDNLAESIFHSVSFPIFRDCVDHYKAGARKTGLYVRYQLKGNEEYSWCNL